ncbi:hypothetical protein M0813_27437 [Anaeramoeba flamelloides]|uniref:Uncharacterized protein n=1 Tax=Anaeramoeba flamelloides TaxID=1746091 RepID=A0ABQ8XVR0_9EUKA|nr:hypothetical protein M0813_27437 [Anaeramoeba flamelloides]
MKQKKIDEEKIKKLVQDELNKKLLLSYDYDLKFFKIRKILETKQSKIKSAKLKIRIKLFVEDLYLRICGDLNKKINNQEYEFLLAIIGEILGEDLKVTEIKPNIGFETFFEEFVPIAKRSKTKMLMLAKRLGYDEQFIPNLYVLYNINKNDISAKINTAFKQIYLRSVNSSPSNKFGEIIKIWFSIFAQENNFWSVLQLIDDPKTKGTLDFSTGGKTGGQSTNNLGEEGDERGNAGAGSQAFELQQGIGDLTLDQFLKFMKYLTILRSDKSLMILECFGYDQILYRNQKLPNLIERGELKPEIKVGFTKIIEGGFDGLSVSPKEFFKRFLPKLATADTALSFEKLFRHALGNNADYNTFNYSIRKSFVPIFQVLAGLNPDLFSSELSTSSQVFNFETDRLKFGNKRSYHVVAPKVKKNWVMNHQETECLKEIFGRYANSRNIVKFHKLLYQWAFFGPSNENRDRFWGQDVKFSKFKDQFNDNPERLKHCLMKHGYDPETLTLLDYETRLKKVKKLYRASKKFFKCEDLPEVMGWGHIAIVDVLSLLRRNDPIELEEYIKYYHIRIKYLRECGRYNDVINEVFQLLKLPFKNKTLRLELIYELGLNYYQWNDYKRAIEHLKKVAKKRQFADRKNQILEMIKECNDTLFESKVAKLSRDGRYDMDEYDDETTLFSLTFFARLIFKEFLFTLGAIFGILFIPIILLGYLCYPIHKYFVFRMKPKQFSKFSKYTTYSMICATPYNDDYEDRKVFWYYMSKNNSLNFTLLKMPLFFLVFLLELLFLLMNEISVLLALPSIFYCFITTLMAPIWSKRFLNSKPGSLLWRLVLSASLFCQTIAFPGLVALQGLIPAIPFIAQLENKVAIPLTIILALLVINSWPILVAHLIKYNRIYRPQYALKFMISFYVNLVKSITYGETFIQKVYKRILETVTYKLFLKLNLWISSLVLLIVYIVWSSVPVLIGIAIWQLSDVQWLIYLAVPFSALLLYSGYNVIENSWSQDPDFLNKSLKTGSWLKAIEIDARFILTDREVMQIQSNQLIMHLGRGYTSPMGYWDTCCCCLPYVDGCTQNPKNKTLKVFIGYIDSKEFDAEKDLHKFQLFDLSIDPWYNKINTKNHSLTLSTNIKFHHINDILKSFIQISGFDAKNLKISYPKIKIDNSPFWKYKLASWRKKHDNDEIFVKKTRPIRKGYYKRF